MKKKGDILVSSNEEVQKAIRTFSLQNYSEKIVDER
jgi:hypothetical protein